MRLTHSVKVEAPGRVPVVAEIHPPDPIGGHNGADIRITQNHNGASETHLWLTWAEFEAVTDLVWAHRPDSAIKDAEIVGDTCGALPLHSGEGCVLKPDHLPIQAGHYTHVNRHAVRFNEDRRDPVHDRGPLTYIWVDGQKLYAVGATAGQVVADDSGHRWMAGLGDDQRATWRPDPI